jgi:hypothetical protein
MSEDDVEIVIKRITERALKAVTPEEMALVLMGLGALQAVATTDGVVMRFVEPLETRSSLDPKPVR